jgi:hypothetical protein
MKNLAITRFLSLALLCCASIPLAAVNYDTAWTFVYDGGKDSASGFVSPDKFFDVKALSNGDHFCVGESNARTLLLRFNSFGKMTLNKLYTTNNKDFALYNSQSGHSIFLRKKGDLIIGGERFLDPWIMCLDTAGNIKWTQWYYDSTKGVTGSFLFGKGIVNCIRELPDGKILAVAGDEYPDNGGNNLNNYAALLTLDSTGKVISRWQWDTPSGNTIGGFYVDVAREGGYLIAGNQSLFCISPTGGSLGKKNYTFSLDGVGTVTNTVMRAKVTRSGAIIVAGQAYEGNCWENYKKLIYDAWWSPISYPDGSPMAWDTAGYRGRDDHLYDFTQLINGNLVFTGAKGTPSPNDSGVWVFVTDSTGKKILWEKQYNLPGVDAGGYKLNNMQPVSVCATPDTGFTVVGNVNTYGNNYNAFAAHFKPAPPVTISSQKSPALQKSTQVRVSVSGSRVVFTLPQQRAGEKISVEVFDGVGRSVTAVNGSGSAVWDAKSCGVGVYFWKSVGYGVKDSGNFIVAGKR